jgi:hydroxyacylglutathione hydrolase
VDVRTAAEREARAIAGSRHVPLAQLQRLAAELPKTGDLVVVCGSGYRSCIAASLLVRDGHAGVADLIGGMAAWPASAA